MRQFKYRILVYVSVFLLFFSFYINNDILPGWCDNLLNLAIFNDYYQWFMSFFGEEYTSANFPEGALAFRGESSVFTGMIYVISHLLISNEITAFSFTYFLVFTANAIAIDLLIRKLFNADSSWVLISTVFVFSFTGFNLGLMDNITYCVWFPGFLGIYFWILWQDTLKEKYAWLFALCFTLQLYSSVYNFAMCVILLSIVFLFYIRKKQIRYFSLSFSLMIISCAVFVWIYTIKFPALEMYEISLKKNLSFSGLTIEYFQNRIPFHWSGRDNDADGLAHYWQLYYPGIGLVISLCLLVLLKIRRQHKLVVFSILAIGFLISSGASIFGVRNMFYHLMMNVPGLYQFKMIFKFYYLVIFALAISWYLVWSKVFSMLKNRQALLLLTIITAIQIIDQIPLNLRYYSQSVPLLDISDSELNEVKDSEKIVLMLPVYAPLLPEDGKGRLFESGRRREYLYYYYKSRYKINILNGANAFLTKQRTELNYLLENTPGSNYLSVLKEKYNVGWLIVSKDDLIRYDPITMEIIEKYNLEFDKSNTVLVKI